MIYSYPCPNSQAPQTSSRRAVATRNESKMFQLSFRLYLWRGPAGVLKLGILCYTAAIGQEPIGHNLTPSGIQSSHGHKDNELRTHPGGLLGFV